MCLPISITLAIKYVYLLLCNEDAVNGGDAGSVGDGDGKDAGGSDLFANINNFSFQVCILITMQ
jgi:hypothetical protein